MKGKKNILFALILAFSAMLTFTFLPQGACVEVQDIFDTKETSEILLYEGDLVIMKVYSLTRIAVTNPGVADVSTADVNEVLLIGRSVGETPIFIWDEYGKRKVVARVLPVDLDLTIERIKRLLVAAKIESVNFEKNNTEGKIVATGKIAKQKKEDLDKILEPFAGNILNMVKEEGKLIHIDAQISELTTTLTKALGFDWTTGGTGIIFSYPETLPTFDGSVGDFFKIGSFSRATAITATVSALLAEGKGKVLSKPSVVVTDGESASFLVGGEIPITTITVGDNSTTENITFRSYGVNVTVTPTIKGDKIDLQMNVSVSDVDSAHSVGDISAFMTTSATTKLMLDDGQTIVLAGLIKHNTSETVKRVPFLSDIPIVGMLFRHKTTPNSEREVVISLTPRIFKDEAEEKASAAEAVSEKNKKEEASILKTEGVPLPAPTGENVEAKQEDAALLPFVTEAAEEKENLPVMMEEELKKAPLSDKKISFPAPAQEQEPLAKGLTSYVQSIQKKISQRISFPYEAKEKNQTGTVRLELLVLSDGRLQKVSVQESSGYPVFDKDAVNTAQLAAPFEPFPAEIALEELTLTIPIVYSQEAVLENEGPK